MAKFDVYMALAVGVPIKQGDCSSGKTTPLFFDYMLKKDTLLKHAHGIKQELGF